MEFDNKYEKQMISIDISIFSIIDNRLHVLLIKRAKEPFIDKWSLIGGGVYNNETCENAVIRELKEKVNIKDVNPILSGVFSEPDRDIRFRNISISYYCLSKNDIEFIPNKEKAESAKWIPTENLGELAFDHSSILRHALNQLKSKVYDINSIKQIMPDTFTLKALQSIYESILETSLDKRNFRRKINSLNCLEATEEKNELDTHKKSEIYKFK